MYLVRILNAGEMPGRVARLIREYQPGLSWREAGDLLRTRYSVVATLDDQSKVINCVQKFADAGAPTDVRDKNDFSVPPWMVHRHFKVAKLPSPSHVLMTVQQQAAAKYQERVRRESQLDSVLNEYYRSVIQTIVPESLEELHQWANESLHGLYRIRLAQAGNGRYLYTVETTNLMDSLYVKMRFSDFFVDDDLNDTEKEWIWDKPSRLFGDNPPTLSYLVGTEQIIHPDGTPYSFAKGIDVSYRAPVEIVTKDRLYALAPKESQREMFLKYCEDYDVLVHYTSEPFTDTVVDDALFNAIVSVDFDKMDGFEAIWASAFERFQRDTGALNILHLAQVKT